ncbi:unnamed protein product [Debaryomyces tyrocola]|nr:unnamed protein product [Debaryomyces tyrocola]
MMLKYIRESKMTNDMDLNILVFLQILELKTIANEISEYHDEIAKTLHLRLRRFYRARRSYGTLFHYFSSMFIHLCPSWTRFHFGWK